VNTAARMETVVEPGALCVNAATWGLLVPHCRGRSQGCIPVKGKGEMEVFHVEEVLSRG